MINLPGRDYDSVGKFLAYRSPYGDDTTFPQFSAPDIFTQTDARPDVAIKIPPGAMDNRLVVETGLHKDRFRDDRAVFKMDEELSEEERKQLIHWDFNGVDYQITKAIRIWYTYETENPKKPGTMMTVGAFLLVGFVGNGQP